MGLSDETLTFVVHENSTFAADGTNASNTTKTVTVHWTATQNISTLQSNINTAIGKGNNEVSVTVDKDGKIHVRTGEWSYLSGVSANLTAKTGLTAGSDKNSTRVVL